VGACSLLCTCIDICEEERHLFMPDDVAVNCIVFYEQLIVANLASEPKLSQIGPFHSFVVIHYILQYVGFCTGKLIA
jgi:hypothetical protein